MAPIGEDPDGLPLVIVAAMAGQGSTITVIISEGRPASKAERNQREDVRVQASGLGRIDAELALVARDGHGGKLGVGLPEFLELPDAGWATSWHSAQVLRVLDDGHAPVAPSLSILAGRNRPDAKMDELVPLTSLPLHPIELHVGDAPRVEPVPDRGWPIVVGPSRSRPGGARRGKHDDVVLAAADAGQDGFLGL